MKHEAFCEVSRKAIESYQNTMKLEKLDFVKQGTNFEDLQEKYNLPYFTLSRHVPHIKAFLFLRSDLYAYIEG